MQLHGTDLDKYCTSVRADMGQLYFACSTDDPRRVGIIIVSNSDIEFTDALAWAVSNGHIQQEKSA